MQDPNMVLLIILYSLGIILLTLLIVLTVKVIITVGKVEKTVENVNEKLNSFNQVFNLIDFTTDRIASVSDVMINKVSSFILGMFKRKKEETEEVE